MLSAIGLLHYYRRCSTSPRSSASKLAHSKKQSSTMQTITRTFVCPDIDSQSAAMLIEQTLADTPGVMESDVSLANRTVVVKLRDVEGEATVRRHLVAAGFPPED